MLVTKRRKHFWNLLSFWDALIVVSDVKRTVKLVTENQFPYRSSNPDDGLRSMADARGCVYGNESAGLGRLGRRGAWLSHPRRNWRITVLSSRMRHKRKSMRKRGRENEGRGSSKELATRFSSIIYVCRNMPKWLQEAANPIQ